MNLVFYDDACPLCKSAVRWISAHDKHHKFQIEPLETSTLLVGSLQHLKTENSLVLIERPGGRIWLRGRAVFRIIWLLGGKWKWIGWLYAMPFIDIFYRIIARHRHKFFR